MSLEYEEGRVKDVRERVVDHLAACYARGNLAVEEYERRVTLATNSVVVTEIESLVSDLPALPAPQPGTAASALTAYTGEIADPSQIRESQSVINVFSGMDKGGEWLPARNVTVVNVFGGGDLDFRDAHLPKEGVTVNVVSVFGGGDIYVPEDVNVEVNGFALFGGFGSKVPEGRRFDAPTIRVNGFCLFGGVDVKTKSR